MNPQINNGKIKILKLEPLSTSQLKRRRSHSHNGGDLSNNEYFSSNGNGHQYFLHTHKDSSPMESTQLKQIMNNPNSPYLNNQLIKDKHKKETHNRVERKRRDFINCQIQKLAELLPTEFFLNCDLKMNKGVILKNSVEYITSMKLVGQINQQLIHENDLGAKLIRTLITSNDLNCSQLSINENFSRTEIDEETDIEILLNQWYKVHQENKQLLQQFTHKFSTSLSESRDNYSNFGDIVLENVSANDTKNNNASVKTHIPCRKRYSSLPANISPDSQFQRVQNSVNMHLIPDKSSPILNSLLKKPNNHHFTHNETLESLYRIDSNEEGVDFYLRYSASPIANQTANTDNALIIDTSNTESEKDCKFFYSKDKTYYILPKSVTPDFISQLDDGAANDNCTVKLLHSVDRSEQFIQPNDPMLLSSSPPHP